ncbi:hypothetical protein J6590_058401 [Homalodisca vitripennis]|nr:hypothetical protein J6590_058401 [Homalodisca vitripennis]
MNLYYYSARFKIEPPQIRNWDGLFVGKNNFPTNVLPGDISHKRADGGVVDLRDLCFGSVLSSDNIKPLSPPRQ